MTDQADQIRIPPQGAKGSTMALVGALRLLFRPLAKMQISRYRGSKGSAQPLMMGFPTVLLTTVGARSGIERINMLGGFPDGEEAWLIVASNSGSRFHPAWFINLAQNPDKVWLEVGHVKFKAKVDSLQGQARMAALERVVAVAPRYGSYQKNTDREIPVIRLTPAV